MHLQETCISVQSNSSRGCKKQDVAIAAYLEAFWDLHILGAPMELGEALKHARAGARRRIEVAIAGAIRKGSSSQRSVLLQQRL